MPSDLVPSGVTRGQDQPDSNRKLRFRPASSTRATLTNLFGCCEGDASRYVFERRFGFGFKRDRFKNRRCCQWQGQPNQQQTKPWQHESRVALSCGVLEHAVTFRNHWCVPKSSSNVGQRTSNSRLTPEHTNLNARNFCRQLVIVYFLSHSSVKPAILGERCAG
jgi:hypothetical protein